MAITRAEFTALAARVAALEGKASTPVVTPEPDPTPVEPAPAILLGKPKVSLLGRNYTLQAVVKTGKDVKFTYLQLAVRGAGAKDLALTPGAKMGPGDTKTLLGSGTNASGKYSAYLAYSLDGTTWVDGPKVHFTAAESPVVPDPTPNPNPTPGTGKIPLIGASRLPFNSLVFRQSKQQMEEFGQRRGNQMDGLLFFTGRDQWGDFRWIPDGQRELVEAGRLVVTTMPHAPQTQGDEMNQRGANDDYRDEQRALARFRADQGFNSVFAPIRVNWEANGDWYNWSANRPGGWQALRQAIINFVTNMRAGGLTKVPFVLCFNKGPNQSGAAFEFFPGPEYIDVVSIDQYDMWAPSYSQDDWEREMAKPPSMRAVAKLAKDNGIQWAVDECGNTHGDDGSKGGDNPKYWEFMKAELMRGIDNLAWHVTYDDRGAPDTLRHDFERNPDSWPTYKSLWSPS